MTAAMMLMAASGAVSFACGDTERSTGSAGGNTSSEAGVGGGAEASGGAAGAGNPATGGNSAGTGASVGDGGALATGATGGTDATGGQPAGDGGRTGGSAGAGGSDATGGAGGDAGSGGAIIGSGGDGDGGTATGGASGGAPGGTGGDNPATGGSTGGAAMVYGVDGQSCAWMTGTECNGESCCTSIEVPGGTFPMGRGTETCSDCVDGCPYQACSDFEQPEHPATVSSFVLDKYEVTLGRVGAFMEAVDGTAPPVGSGAHPQIPGSGWDSAWDIYVPADSWEISDLLMGCGPMSTWTPTDREATYAADCVHWWLAFAFCIWDGGRLPTEAEWEYAAAGGDENRVYPWGNDMPDPPPANCQENHNTPFLPVGSEPLGNSRWGHADLGGSMREWVLDYYSGTWYTTMQAGCNDCACLTAEGSGSRVLRGTLWQSPAESLRAAWRGGQSTSGVAGIGFRCARDP